VFRNMIFVTPPPPARMQMLLLRTPVLLIRAQEALREMPGPQEDAACGGFNPLQCSTSALRAVSQLLYAAQPAPHLPPAAQVCAGKSLPDLNLRTGSTAQTPRTHHMTTSLP
jgi:hypothetical protein